jgi:uncharacterized iron-regulated membrane protein
MRRRSTAWTTVVAAAADLGALIGAVLLPWILMIALDGKSTMFCRLFSSLESRLISASRKRRDRSPSDDRRDLKRRT